MSKPIIEVEGLSKSYQLGETVSHDTLRDAIAHGFRSIVGWGGERNPARHREAETLWALKDVNFNVQEGDVLGIIGRNGAGKSTLLKILSRITDPTSGTARIRGRVASLLEVGTGFHPELTGRENVFLNGAILGMTRKEMKSKFDEIVAFAEVDRFIDTPVKRYSSGMYVRLAFAVAAHLDPEILIVDEVLAVGDAAFQKKCLGKMKDVSQKGRTVLFVSHNMTAIRALCNRAILFKEGMLATDSVAHDVIEGYISEQRECTLSREWNENDDAPNNASAVLEMISIRDNRGRLMREIYTDTPFNVEIIYRVKLENTSVGMNVIIYDNENNCVLGSINNHELNWYGKPMPAGRYKSICKIPKNFFNNGLFSLCIVIFGKNFSDQLLTDRLLRFEILDGAEVRGDYYGNYSSCTRPMFQWETVMAEENNL